MQLFSRNKALAALSLGALAALGACGDDVTVAAPTPAPVTVTISPSNANVAIGSTVTLAVTVTGGTTTPDYQCSVSPTTGIVTVAKVAGGCSATGVAAGSATVIATAGTATAAAAVTVAAPAPAISGIAITPAAINLQVGARDTIRANPTSNPTNAVVTRAYVSSNPAVASVNPTNGGVTAVAPGTATITVTLSAGTGATAATVSGTAQVTVTALPPSVTAVSATPTSATLIVSQTQQLTATATYQGGNTGTITYGTSNPGVAQVSGTGLITAVGPGQAVITVTASSAGNASFAAASATAQVPVTVNAAPQVSIANITRQDGTPVILNNVAGQIQVQVNLLTNNNNVSSLALYICDAGQNCTSTAQPAAQQNFGTAGAASGDINLFINTADFTTDFATATAKYLNGQKNLIAVLNVANSNANSNLAILNFNNSDTFAAKHTPPSRPGVVSPTTNTTFFGGPGAEGRGRIQIAPLMYTPGRSIVAANVSTTSTVCAGTLDFGGTNNAFPIDYTYGTSIGASPANAKNIVCSTSIASNGAADPDLTAKVISSIDNQQNAGPAAANAAAFATTTSSVPAVTAPASIRVDYAAPTFTVTNPTTRWASGTLNNYNWRTNTSTPTDAGVGSRATSTFTYAYTGCTTGNGGTSVAMPNASASDVPQCSNDFTNAVYTVAATGSDLLGNTATFSTSNTFGIDNTKPTIRYAVGGASATPGAGNGTVADTTTYSASTVTALGFAVTAVPVAGDSIFLADALDERSGLNTASNILVRANQAGSTCVRGTGTVTNFITGAGCTYSSSSPTVSFGNTLADGFRQIIPRVYGSDFGIGTTPVEGYYTYSAIVVDRAGNADTLPVRRVLFNNTQPAMTGLGIPGTITAAGPNAFTPNFTENVEAWVTNLSIGYGSGSALQDPTGTTRANLMFPAQLYNARFDNSIGANGNFTATTPFSSGVNIYTNIEYTSTAGALNNAASSRPDSAYARVINVGGNLSTGNAGAGGFFGVQLLSGNVNTDAANWSAFNTNIQSFTLGTLAAAWNAPANGVKAIVTASTNQINSPFTRVDFYEYQTANPTVIGAAAGQWVYIGQVDASATPCVSAASDCGVYIADNGASRVWTYRLKTAVNGVNGLAAGSAISLTSGGSRRFMAIASNGTKGRVLATNPADAVSSLPSN